MLARGVFILTCLFHVSIYADQTNFVDKDSKVKSFAQKNWFIENIPFIEIPDKTIEEIYYYRWSVVKRHLRYMALGSGYVVTEFLYNQWWSLKFGELNAAGGHQIYESRWIRNTRYIKDYINFYARQDDKESTHQFSEWIAEAAYNAFLVNGDKDFINGQLEGFVNIYKNWEEHYDKDLGLYFITPEWDAQEYSCASVQTNDKYHGGLGYRPSHNSEMYGNGKVIENIARIKGDHKIEAEFKEKNKELRENIIKHLWDKERNFFYHMQRENNPDHKLLDSREEVGFYPWRFGVPDDRYNFSIAFDQLFDKKAFWTEYGPSTCEARSKWFNGEQTPGNCCWWNGNSWPYSTAHVLRSLATHLRQYSYQNPKITVDNYLSLLQKYAIIHYKNNKPYVAECHSPVHQFWVCDSYNHSEHYLHSTFLDNVLTDLMGVLPQEDNKLIIDPLIPKYWSYFAVEDLLYHGKNVSIVYDKSGDMYKIGKGLTVFVNGEKKAHRDDLGPLTVDVGQTKMEQVKRLENYAANLNMWGYPVPHTSYSDNNPGTPYQAIDGRIFYDYVPTNRWSNYNSKHETDWFAVDFGRQKTFDSINVYIYSDVVTKEGRTDCPTKMVVQYMDQKSMEWSEAQNQVLTPSKCAPNDLNRITFSPVKTSQLRVVFTRNVEKDYYVGITELEVWAPFPQTDSPNVYEAEDGIITEADMESSDSASGQAYVSGIEWENSNVEMGGIYATKAEDYKVRVFYANGGTHTSTHRLLVNNLKNISVSYPPTSSGWGHFSDKNFVEIPVPLLYGYNVLQFNHDNNLADIDKIQINNL